MNFNEVARQLKDFTYNGKINEIKQLLGPFTNKKDIRWIEDKFMSQSDGQADPVNYAIDCGKEKIAKYFVEKAFSLHHIYWEKNAVCDEWCYKDHGPDECPRQYDCGKNAEKHNMETLKLLVDSIKQGKNRPGDGLSEPYIEKFMPHTPPARQQRPRQDKPDQVRNVQLKRERTAADEAQEIVQKYGIRYSTKKGGTLLHLYVEKPRVYTYILANHGVPVNVQDVNGDTALHVAVRKNKLDIVEALVQCGADLSLRNKMGQTPVEEAEGTIRAFLRTFEPGMVVAVRDSHYNMLCRLYKRTWCHVHTKVKDGKSLLEWTQEKSDAVNLGEIKPSLKNELKKEADAARNSYRVLSEYRPTSELIHAVLCEDVELARQVLWAHRDLKVNFRFKDRIGKTLLSHAIDVNNFDLVNLLVENGAHVGQIRVRENEETDVTVPLYQKALRKDVDVNIVKLLQTVLPDSREHEEKDTNGNTPLLRAIEEGVEARTIHWLLKIRGGYSLLDRNKDGFTAREIAVKRGRDDVVKVIDKYILKDISPIVLRLFPVSFCSPDLLTTVDESGVTLEQKLSKTAEERNMKSWLDINETQNQAISLFTAVAKGDMAKVEQLNNAYYQDKNGYTALIRAVVFNQLDVANLLCIHRPALRKMPDNCNRYPLHYAYALPDDQAKPFIRLILEKDATEIESRMDKDGRVAAVYKELRKDKEILQMLYDARTLDVFGKRGSPLGPWPMGAETAPPDHRAITLDLSPRSEDGETN